MAVNTIDIQTMEIIKSRYMGIPGDLDGVLNIIHSIKRNTDAEVLNRDNLRNRIDTVIADIETIENGCRNIYYTLDTIKNKYRDSEALLNQQLGGLNDLPTLDSTSIIETSNTTVPRPGDSNFVGPLPLDMQLEATGATITDEKTGYKSAAEGKDGGWLSKIGEGFVKTWCALDNICISMIKGVMTGFEDLVKSLVLLSSITPTLISYAASAVTDAVGLDIDPGAEYRSMIKTITSTEWVDSFSTWYYDDFAVGKFLKENSYEWGKPDSTACEISNGIGYIGSILITACFTGGASAGGQGLSIGSKILSPGTLRAIIAGLAGFGKGTADAWNQNNVTTEDGSEQELGSLTYNQLQQLRKGQQVDVEANGTIISYIKKEDGTYWAVVGDEATQITVDETGLVKGYGLGTIKGLWEAGQWFAGDKISGAQFGKITSKISNPLLKKLTSSFMRMGLDTLTGAVEVPFQTTVTSIQDNISWKEAWDRTGGWKAVGVQSAIAGLSSGFGEAVDFASAGVKAYKNKMSYKDALRMTDLENSLSKSMSKYNKMYENAPDNVKQALDARTSSNLSGKDLKMYEQLYQMRDSLWLEQTKLEAVRRTIGKGNLGKYTHKFSNNYLQSHFDKLNFDEVMGKRLEDIFFQDDYIIGVHKSGGQLGSLIMNDGLLLTGDLSSGVVDEAVDLNNNISLYTDKSEASYYRYLCDIYRGCYYKSYGNADIVITAIPKGDIDNMNKLIDYSGSTPKLKKEYILGYVNNQHGYFDELQYNPEGLMSKRLNGQSTTTNFS